MNSIKKPVLITIIYALLSTMVWAQNLITNGSFESPEVVQQLPVYYDGIPGWSTPLANIYIHNGFANGFYHGPAQDGTNYLDLSGAGVPHGYVYQNFPTTPGIQYLLRFYTGSSSYDVAPIIHLTLSQNTGDYLIDTNLTPLPVSTGISWKEEVFVFTAQANSTRLQFSDTSNTDDNASYIDNVSVIPLPVIIRQPTANQTAKTGSTVYISVRCPTNETLRFSYQWYFGTNILIGATNSTLTLTNVQSYQSGSYTVVVSGLASSVTSDQAILQVIPSLELNMIPMITVTGEIGLTYNLTYVNTIGSTNDWRDLATITVTNNPQYYFDTSAIGQPARFYRLVQNP